MSSRSTFCRILASLLAGCVFIVTASESKMMEKECLELSTRCSTLSTSATIGCCPQSNATCCDDGLHCCPTGFKCSESIGKCVKDTNPLHIRELIPMNMSLKPNLVKVADGVPCPDGSSCPLNYFCCKYLANKYSCCPANTVCCIESGTLQCCPSGYVCTFPAQCAKACP